WRRRRRGRLRGLRSRHDLFGTRKGPPPIGFIRFVTPGELVETQTAAVLEQQRDERRPPGLVACTEAVSAFTVEELVERDTVAPVDVVLKDLGVAKHGAAAVFVPNEDAGQAT